MTRHERYFLIATLLWTLAALYWMTLLGAALAVAGAVVVAKAVKAQVRAGDVVRVNL